MWEQAKKIPHLKVVSLNKKSRWDLVFFIRLIRFLRVEKPDLIYSFLPAANLICLAMRPFVTSAKLIWGIRSSKIEYRFFDSFSKWIWKIECLLSRAVTLIIANSDAGAKHALDNGAPASKIRVISNGIDTKRFLPNESHRHRLRDYLSIGDEEWVVGTVGRFDPLKDHETFLKAAEKILKRKKNVRFVLVGVKATDNDFGKKFSELVAEKKIIFSGFIQDPISYFQMMDLYCSSSTSEGFSNSIAEAMSCGLPAVVTDVGDSKKIVGQTGWVVPPSDADALADGILIQLSRMELARDEMAEAARSRILQNYPIEKLGQKITAVFNELLVGTQAFQQTDFAVSWIAIAPRNDGIQQMK